MFKTGFENNFPSGVIIYTEILYHATNLDIYKLFDFCNKYSFRSTSVSISLALNKAFGSIPLTQSVIFEFDTLQIMLNHHVPLDTSKITSYVSGNR